MTKGERIHENVKEQKKNTKNNTKTNDDELDHPSSEDIEELRAVFSELGINYSSNSKHTLEALINDTLDARVIRRIIRQNQKTWSKYKGKPQQYKFTILKNQIENDYRRVKYQLEAERIEQQRMAEEFRKRPRINYDNFPRTEQKEEGLGDISDLLNEI